MLSTPPIIHGRAVAPATPFVTYGHIEVEAGEAGAAAYVPPSTKEIKMPQLALIALAAGCALAPRPCRLLARPLHPETLPPPADSLMSWRYCAPHPAGAALRIMTPGPKRCSVKVKTLDFTPL